MNSLLIYSQNEVSQLVNDFDKKLGKTCDFQVGKQDLLIPSFSIDEKMNDFFVGKESKIENKKYDVIFIPYSLSAENYIEFLGLRFAFHIRLTPSFNNLQTPIVFFGYENVFEVNKVSELGSILFSKNIFTTDKISIEDFRNQIEYITKNHKEIVDDDFIEQFMKRNTITPSGNYATHHSITNEWSIYRWAKALKIDNQQIQKIERNIGGNLYFKYLKAKYPIKDIQNVEKIRLQESGRILYIDDEIEKGWDNIFKYICEKDYEPFGADFKKWDSQTIIDKTVEKIHDFEPDVVVLDFRLHDDDFSDDVKPKDVTGYKILENIKEINKGIQVIILSATNKIWNLLKLQEAKADGFIMKESPELSMDENFSNTQIDHIYKEINDKLMRAKKLKNLHNQISKINDLVIKTKEFDDDFPASVTRNMEIAYKLAYDSFKISEKEYVNYSYLQFFLIIEEYLKQPKVFVEGDNCYVFQDGKEFLVRQKKIGKKYTNAISFSDGHFLIKQEEKEDKRNFLDVNFKMSAVLLFKFGFPTSGAINWTKIYTIRNEKAAHPIKTDLVTFGEIDMLMNFIQYIFNNENLKDVNLSKALPEQTWEEQEKALQNSGKFKITKQRK